MDGVWNFQIIVSEPLGGKGPSRGERKVRSIEGEREGEVYSRGWVGRNQSEMHGLGGIVDLNTRGEVAWAVSGESPLHDELSRRVYAPTGK